MVPLTRKQRVALFRIWQRDNPGWISPGNDGYAKVPTTAYREYRRTVRPFLGGDCVMVPRWGMWLGIETDGYTHS
jgi:hypothetical protein